MKKFSLFLAALLLLVLSSVSYSKNYYVCDSTGNDDNDGLSESTAFKSYPKAISTFNKMFAGDSVLFCRGGNFPVEVDMRIYNNKCGASLSCTLSSYGDESLPKPTLISQDQIVLNFQNGGNAKPDGGYVVRGFNIVSNSPTKKNAVVLYNDVDDVILDDLHIEGFRIGVYSGGANSLDPLTNGINDRFVLKNSVIINNSSIGFFGGCQNCYIENNTFENNGFGQKILDHNIYLGWGGFPAEGVTIRNNTLYKSTHIDGKCQGVSLVAHGLFKDLTIEGNTIKEDVGKVSGYCWGISVDPGYSKEEAFYNVLIKNNTLINVGNVGIGCASCEGVTIVDNTIIDEGNALKFGISVPVREEDSVKSKEVLIKNNRIIFDNADAFGIKVGGENVSVAEFNHIYQPAHASNECVDRSNANIDIDISSNKCKKHNGLQLMNLISGSSDTEDSTIADEIGDITEEADKGDTAINEDARLNSQEQSASKKRTAKSNQIEENNITESNSVSKSSVLDSTKSTTSSARSVSSSSGSKSSIRSSSNSNADNKLQSEVISNNKVISSRQSSVSNISETAESDQLPNEPVTSSVTTPSQRSSIKSVTINEVINATKEDNSNVEPSTCRAYSRGVCLMR